MDPAIPLVRKRHTETLIGAIRYFYRFLPIFNEFSVRGHRADVKRVHQAVRARWPRPLPHLAR
jgi:hypothetical protein